jgi:hypothetical protein
MYTNTLTSISGDDLLVAPSYGKDLILEVSANNDIFFKKGEITKRFDNLVSDYLDMSFVREASFNSLNSQVEYILQEISGSSVLNFITSGISSDLLIKSYDGRDIVLEVSGNSEIIFKRGDISYNLDDLIGGGGGFSQSSDYATYNILDITGKIIFTDNSTNVQYYNDASLNNVDISGSLKVAGSISAPNIYTKTEIDNSFTNVYSKLDVLDSSLTNVYTKSQVYTKTEIDVSFVSKELFDASLSSIQLSNVYTKEEIDVSFVSKELFETSYNFLLSSVGTSNESGDGGYFQNNDHASYDILNITDTIIFTDNSNNVQQINDASLNNVDISGSLKVAGSISAPNIYTKSEIDLSFTNVYTKSQVYTKSEVDNSFTNVYTKSQVYTKTEVDVSFVSKESFDASLNGILSDGVFIQNNDYASYDILDITGEIIFTDSSNVQRYIDISLNNVDICGSLNVAGYISAPNIYTKNQVYTKTEIDASLANVYTKSLDVCGNVTFRGSTLYVPSLFTIDPFGYGDNTGTVLINGNLVVEGETTTINSSVVDISDKVLVLASNASNSLHADGAGFEISGAKVNLLYNNSSNTFRSSIGMSISGNVVPVSNGVGSLGESGKIWDIAYIRELNVTNFTNSIDGSKIASGTISSTQIENGSILTVDISDHAITYEKIAVNAVTNTRIANGAVTHAKLSSDCIQSHNIVDGTIMDVDISANAAISGSKIANASITNDKINQANNWTFSQLTSTSANIRDVSITNIEVSGNIVPLRDLSSNLGSSLKRWRNVYANDLSVNTINGQAYTGSSGGGDVYTRGQVDLSFVSKQLFDASINALAVSGGGGGSSSTPYDNNIKILPDWIPLVEISNNLYTNLGFGSFIAFSKDGYTVATYVDYRTPGVAGGAGMVGRIIVYHYNGGSWVQKGLNLDGTNTHSGNGLRTTLSNDGNILAVGFSHVRYIYNENGNWVRGGVQIYKYNLTTFLWEPMGSFIIPIQSTIQYGNVHNELFGDSMSFSNDGTIIAIGAPYSLWYHGAVLIYKYETRNSVLDWYYSAILSFFEFQIDINIFGGTQDGIYIYPNGGLEMQYFGSQVTLSSDGTVVAGSAPYGPSNSLPDIRVEPPAGGIVRIFKFNGTSWVNTGRIVGEYENDGGGITISLSGNGDYIAIGTQYNSGNGQWNGHVRVYKWNNSDSSWNQLGLDIDGQGGLNSTGLYARTGNSISLSYDGTILAVSANDPSEYKMGRVYKWDGTAWNRYGNGFNPGTSIFLTNDGNRLASGISSRASIVIYNLVQNNIVSLNSTNLFCLDGYNYSYKKKDIKTSVYSTSESSVHSEYYSDFPNKFTRTLYILQNGSLYNRNNTYGSFSDIRLKENIVDATPKLEDLLKVRVVNYNLIGSSNKYIGVVAQELEEIFPGLVETETSGQKYKSVKYSCMNIMLVKALQEQQVLINDMSSNISTLKDEVATLKQGINSLTARLEALEATSGN